MRKAHAWAVFTVAAAVGLGACGGGGNGGRQGMASHPIGDRAIRTADVVARADANHEPLDAAPSPDGTVVYYTLTGDAGAAVYRVPAGGGAISTIAEAAPLAKPSGVH